MGSRIQKIAGIILALAFVALLVIMNTNVLNLGNNANKKMQTSLAMTDSSGLSAYADTTVTGDVVINAIKNGKNLDSTSKLYIKVITKEGSTETYGYKDNSDTFTPYKAPNPNLSSFINPYGEFSSKLHPNDNGVTDGIEFEQLK